MSISAGTQTALVKALTPDIAFFLTPLRDALKVLPRVLSKSQSCFSVDKLCLEKTPQKLYKDFSFTGVGIWSM